MGVTEGAMVDARVGATVSATVGARVGATVGAMVAGACTDPDDGVGARDVLVTP